MTTAGLSTNRLAQLHEIMARHVDRGAAPVLVSLVSRRGEAHVDIIGATALDGRHAMRPDTIFRISSMTNPVTAVATLILLEECVLRLDEPVERFLPELSDRRVVRRIDGPVDDTVPAHRPITVRDLLAFRMGFGGPTLSCSGAAASLIGTLTSSTSTKKPATRVTARQLAGMLASTIPAVSATPRALQPAGGPVSSSQRGM